VRRLLILLALVMGEPHQSLTLAAWVAKSRFLQGFNGVIVVPLLKAA
jgi:hypothetical protein